MSSIAAVSGSCVHYMRMQCRNLPTILLQVARDTNIVQVIEKVGVSVGVVIPVSDP